MRRLLASATMAAAMILSGGAAASAADDPTPDMAVMHDVVCSIEIDTPKMITATAVGANGRVRCNASPDVAITSIQLQIYRDGRWSNFGTGRDLTTTQPNFGFSDTAGAAVGCYSYRAQMVREAFHGTWDTSAKTSGSARLCRND